MLTNDADFLICSLYYAYWDRIKNGASKLDACFFGSAEAIQEHVIPEWSAFDISDTARELSSLGFISALFANDELVESALLPKGIAYVETRFGRKIDRLLQRLADLRTIIFG